VRGAAVVGLDLDTKIESLHNRDDFLGVSCDVTDETQVRSAIEKAVLTFGGLDMLVLNAGIFPASHKIADLPTEEWRKAMSVNLDAKLGPDAHLPPVAETRSPRRRVVVIRSKTFPRRVRVRRPTRLRRPR